MTVSTHRSLYETLLGWVLICFQNSLSSSWHGFHKMLETLWDSGPCCHDHTSCRLFLVALLCCKSPVIPHLKGFLLNSELVFAKANKKHSTCCPVHEVSLTWLLLSNTVCYHADIKRWVKCDRGIRTILKKDSGIQYNDCLALTGPKCVKKIFPIHNIMHIHCSSFYKHHYSTNITQNNVNPMSNTSLGLCIHF